MLAFALVAALASTAEMDFVSVSGTDFVLGGSPYRFAGTNCYYLLYKDRFMVDDALESAAAAGFEVVRTWAFLDIGKPDGSDSVDKNGAIKDGVYIQYWSDTENKPVVNGTNLEGLDYAIAKAGSLGMRVLLTLTNNWADFGGMDQYVMWKSLLGTDGNATSRGAPKMYHDDFYTDPTIKGWYKAYAKHLVTRRNTVTGRVYADDSAIFGWELANEPRCGGTGAFGQSKDCVVDYAVYGKDPVAAKTTPWAREMSDYMKSIDPNHLVAVGDEGFSCLRYQTCNDATCDCYYGVDNHNLTALPSVDFMSLHLYPESWGKDVQWATDYIQNHTRDAHTLHRKPVLLGEYGFKSNQHSVYQQWTGAMEASGMNADLVWMISGQSDAPGDNGWVQNYDGYAVYCPLNSSAASAQHPPGDAQTCPVLSAHAQRVSRGNAPTPPPATLPPTPAPAPTPAPQCKDVAPDSQYSCADQKSWGKCDTAANPWMVGYCCLTCFGCAPGCGA